MKKLLRFISLTLVFLMICFTFCGCDALDEMRKKHAVWVDEEETVISLNGKEYKLLPECELFAPIAYDYISLTESDVPLLLADMYSEYYAAISQDKAFIVVDPYEDYTQYFDKESETKYYCASNRYDEICDRINSIDSLEYLCYEYDKYDFDTGDYITELYFLTEEEIETVSTVLKEGAISSLYGEDSYGEYNITIFNCSEDALFRKYAFDLIFKGNDAYLMVEYFSDDGFLTDSMNIVVPDELYDTFRGMASKYIDSMEMDW